MDKTNDKKHGETRSPVVVIVGHVDHGKTTLLDFIRKTNTIDKEAGGITQSVGAYEITYDGKKITFIDTPGHESFSMMREHGTAIADLAILVVAADEGIKTQTTEAINVLKKTNTTFIVAITKTDKPNADVEKVKNELISAGILLEGNGGDVSWQTVSGATGDGVDKLLELIVLTGEVLELTFDPGAKAYGFVLESRMDNRRGIVANLILKDGILREGDEIITETASGKIKILENFLGERVKELIPSSPALVCSFDNLPKSGEEFWAGSVDVKIVGIIDNNTESVADVVKEVVNAVEATDKNEDDSKEKKTKALLKADSVGSLEVLKQVMDGLVNATDASVGNVLDNDVQFAKSTGSLIIGFGVSVGKSAARLADEQRVEITTSDIIYKLLETVEKFAKSKEVKGSGGVLEVLAIFNSTNDKHTIGGKVKEGAIRRNAVVSIERGGEEVGKGKIASLQKKKENARDVEAGEDAGLVVITDTKIQKGDLIRIS